MNPAAPINCWPAAKWRVCTPPPRSEVLLHSLPLEALFTSRQLPDEILDVLAVEPERLRLHPDAVVELL
jgi:NitT/TauT family transport system substrate-binding protein